MKTTHYTKLLLLISGMVWSWCSWCVGEVRSQAAPAPVANAAPNAATNGGFEEGTEGWMWEQWIGRPLPGVLDHKGAFEGAAWFKMGLAGAQGGRYLAKEIAVPEAGKDYIFSFALKLENVPQGAAGVRLAIPDKGFLHGGDLVRTGGSQDWQTYRFAVPAANLGDAKKVTVFFYHDQMGSGSIGIDALSLVPGALAPGQASPLPGSAPAAPAGDAALTAGTVLTGQTSQPDFNTFGLGQSVELTFSVAGLTVKREGQTPAAPVKLLLSIVDEHGTVIEHKAIPVQPDAGGHWQMAVAAPHARLGFYRVNARLSNGTLLQASGSRPAGFLTYAVVPDPAQRALYNEQESGFGMQGGFGPWRDRVLALLGARWVLDSSLEWRKTEPIRAGEFDASRFDASHVASPALETAAAAAASWKTYSLPTLFAAPQWAVRPATLAYMTGTLTPAGEKAWDAYCRQAARAYAAGNPDRQQHIYQITWEPIPPWGFKGTDRDLMRIYEIAYRALHETDPKAVVAGPTRGINKNDPQQQLPLFKLGLGKYLDAFTTHPYHSINPERDGMVHDLRLMKDILHTYARPGLPLLGTEQGWSTDEDPDKDLTQARGLMRQNLITIGEGFRFNMAYYIADYRLAGQKGYGYYYTLDPDVPFGPRQISPRPIAAAYAAQSLLLDGHQSAGAIEWLGDTAWGYAFERPGSTILALWDYGGKPRQVALPVGEAKVRVYDWMGNARLVATNAGTLSLTLGPEPVYVGGVSSRLWGRGSAKVLTVNKSHLQAYPGQTLKLTGSVLLPSPRPVPGRLTLDADPRLKLQPQSRPLALGTSQRTAFAFELQVPADARAISYPVRLQLRDSAGHSLAATGMTLQVMAPVAVASVRPRLHSRGSSHGPSRDEIALELTLKDVRGQGAAGTLECRLKEVLPAAQRSDLPMIDLVEDQAKTREVRGTARKLSFKLPAGGTQTLTISYSQASVAPTKIYQAVTVVTTAAGYKSTATAPVNFLGARRLSRVPVIDGQLGDWAEVAPVALRGQAAVVRSPQQYAGDADLSSQWRLGWDERGLYVAVEVTDDVFYQPAGGENTWQADCLQLSFDLDAGRDVPDDKRRYSEINLALTPAGAQAYRSLTFDLEKHPPGLLAPAEAVLAIRHEGARLIYEVMLPWSVLGSATAPTSGLLGFAATVNDSDGPQDKDPCALGLYGGITPTKDPGRHGILNLIRNHSG